MNKKEKYLIPDFGMAKSCWKIHGIENEEQYQQWKKDMAEKWKIKINK